MNCDLQSLWDVISPALCNIYIANAKGSLRGKWHFRPLQWFYTGVNPEVKPMSKREIWCIFLALYIIQCVCVCLSVHLLWKKTNAMQSFWNYYRVYRLLKIYLVLGQKYIEFLSVGICMCDANKWKALGSAEQTGCLRFKPTFFFFLCCC